MIPITVSIIFVRAFCFLLTCFLFSFSINHFEDFVIGLCICFLRLVAFRSYGLPEVRFLRLTLFSHVICCSVYASFCVLYGGTICFFTICVCCCSGSSNAFYGFLTFFVYFCGSCGVIQ